jgi:hypothetical protein
MALALTPALVSIRPIPVYGDACGIRTPTPRPAESILKIQCTPPAGATPASLQIVSLFTP